MSEHDISEQQVDAALRSIAGPVASTEALPLAGR